MGMASWSHVHESVVLQYSDTVTCYSMHYTHILYSPGVFGSRVIG